MGCRFAGEAAGPTCVAQPAQGSGLIDAALRVFLIDCSKSSGDQYGLSAPLQADFPLVCFLHRLVVIVGDVFRGLALSGGTHRSFAPGGGKTSGLVDQINIVLAQTRFQTHKRHSLGVNLHCLLVDLLNLRLQALELAGMADNQTSVALSGCLWNRFAFQLADSLVGSSRVDLQACKLEYSIVSPK